MWCQRSLPTPQFVREAHAHQIIAISANGGDGDVDPIIHTHKRLPLSVGERLKPGGPEFVGG
jgi:hypothetical protein